MVKRLKAEKKQWVRFLFSVAKYFAVPATLFSEPQLYLVTAYTDMLTTHSSLQGKYIKICFSKPNLCHWWQSHWTWVREWYWAAAECPGPWCTSSVFFILELSLPKQQPPQSGSREPGGCRSDQTLIGTYRAVSLEAVVKDLTERDCFPLKVSLEQLFLQTP